MGSQTPCEGQRPASLRETHKDREGERGKRVNRAEKQHKVTDGGHLEPNNHRYVNDFHAHQSPPAVPELCPSVIPETTITFSSFHVAT